MTIAASRQAAVILIILLVVVSCGGLIPTISEAHASQDDALPKNVGPYTPPGYDGSILYRILIDTLWELAEGSYAVVIKTAEMMLSAPVPEVIADLHVRVYEKMVSLAKSLAKLGNSTGTEFDARGQLIEVYARYVDLRNTVYVYANLLETSIQDGTLVSTYQKELETVLEALAKHVDQKLASILTGFTNTLNVSVSVNPPVVLAGDTVSLLIRLAEDRLVVAHISLLIPPTFVWNRTIVFRGLTWVEVPTPTANELALHGIVVRGAINATITVYVEEIAPNGSRGFAETPLIIKYLKPFVLIQTTSVVDAGKPIVINITALRPLNATVLFDGITILNVSVKPFGEMIELPTTNVSPGSHSLTIIVHPWGPYTGVVYKTTVTIVGKKCRINALVPAVVFSLTDKIMVRLDLEEDLIYRIRVSVDDNRVLEVVMGGGEQDLGVPVGFTVAPQFKSVEIEVVPLADGYEPTVLQYSILLVNPIGLLLPLVLVVILTANETRHKFMKASGGLAVYRRIRREIARKAGLSRLSVQEYVEYLKLRLKPSIAMMIYKRALRMIGVPAPMPSETLREHYSRVIEPRVANTLATIMRKLMELAELDLYSPRKPSQEELEAKLGELQRAKD